MIFIPNPDLGHSTTHVRYVPLLMYIDTITCLFQAPVSRGTRVGLITTDDDYAASFVASWAKAYEDAELLRQRSSNWKNLFNNRTGFIEARNSDGSWAGEGAGWTEGDHWAYSLDVMVSKLGVLVL